MVIKYDKVESTETLLEYIRTEIPPNLENHQSSCSQKLLTWSCHSPVKIKSYAIEAPKTNVGVTSFFTNLCVRESFLKYVYKQNDFLITYQLVLHVS